MRITLQNICQLKTIWIITHKEDILISLKDYIYFGFLKMNQHTTNGEKNGYK